MSHVEAVEQGSGLVSLGSGDVGLAELILHDTGNEAEDVAKVVGAGIDEVDYVEAADGFLRGDLRGIDGGRGFADIDDLANFLLVRDGDFDGGALRDLNVRLRQGVEAFFFDAKLILAGGEPRERAATGEVGLAADGGQLRQLQENACGGDGDSVFVGDGDGGGRSGLGRTSADEGERKKEGTHAGEGYFTVGCRVAEVGLEVREKQRELAGITARTQAFTSIAVFENSTIRAII